jgi:hypothetical protein
MKTIYTSLAVGLLVFSHIVLAQTPEKRNCNILLKGEHTLVERFGDRNHLEIVQVLTEEQCDLLCLEYEEKEYESVPVTIGRAGFKRKLTSQFKIFEVEDCQWGDFSDKVADFFSR